MSFGDVIAHRSSLIAHRSSLIASVININYYQGSGLANGGINRFRRSSDFESLVLGGGRVVGGDGSAGGTKKKSRMRSQSSIDPSQVRAALKERSKLTREEKRTRNKTTVVSPQVAALRGGTGSMSGDGSPYSSMDDMEERHESIAALKRESHMRKEVCHVSPLSLSVCVCLSLSLSLFFLKSIFA